MSHDLWSVVPQGSDGLEPHLVQYVRNLEALFVEVRGRGVQWSPEDGQLAAGWYRSGIELPRVAKAFEERSKAWRFHHGDRALPRTLSFYRRCVERGRTKQDAQVAPTGLQDAYGDDDPFDQLDALIKQGKTIARQANDRAVSVATDRACAALRRLRDKTELHTDLDALLNRVQSVRERMIANVLQGVGAEEVDRMMQGIQVSKVLNDKIRKQLINQELINLLDQQFEIALPWWGGWARPFGGPLS
ncbi:MAG: hypothetical protein CMH53_04015 [Myxococcales bacterium]|nr:hypothetical protein [Myxococcales bacterium]